MVARSPQCPVRFFVYIACRPLFSEKSMSHCRIGLIVAVCSTCAPGLSSEPRLRSRVVNVPCRLYIQGADAAFYFARSADPEGTAIIYDKQRGTSVERHTTLSAHPFVVDLPPGRYTFTVERGKEFSVTEQTVTIFETGDVPEVALSLERWVDMAAMSWFSGDTRAR